MSADRARSAARARRRRRRSRARRSAPTRRAVSRPARSCSTPCCPATRRSSPTRRTPARSSRSPTRTSATTASTPTTTRAARPFCRGVVVRDLARPPQQLAQRRATSTTFLRRHGVARHRRHRHPPPHPPPPRRGRDARRVRHGRRGDAARGRGERRAGHRRHRPRRRRSPRPSRTPSATDAPFRVVAYDFGIKRTILRHLGARSPRSRSCRRRRPAADVLAREPDGVFLSNGPGDPGDGRRTPSTHIERAARRGAGVRHLPRPPAPRRSRSAARTFKLPFGHHGGNHPVRHLADRPGRDHEPEPQLRGRRRLAARRRRRHPRQPQRRRRRGPARAATRRAFSVQYHPEAGPGPARRALPVRRVHRPDDGRR